jgi:hypothetical protein
MPFFYIVQVMGYAIASGGLSGVHKLIVSFYQRLNAVSGARHRDLCGHKSLSAKDYALAQQAPICIQILSFCFALTSMGKSKALVTTRCLGFLTRFALGFFDGALHDSFI